MSDELDVPVEAVNAARRYAEEHSEKMAEDERERRRVHDRSTGESKRPA